jgi:hypothetical protein
MANEFGMGNGEWWGNAELKIEDLWMSLAQRRRLRRVSLRPFLK